MIANPQHPAGVALLGVKGEAAEAQESDSSFSLDTFHAPVLSAWHSESKSEQDFPVLMELPD